MKEVARKEINEEREKKLFLENFNIEIRKLFYFIVYLYQKKKQTATQDLYDFGVTEKMSHIKLQTNSSKH